MKHSKYTSNRWVPKRIENNAFDKLDKQILFCARPVSSQTNQIWCVQEYHQHPATQKIVTSPIVLTDWRYHCCLRFPTRAHEFQLNISPFSPFAIWKHLCPFVLFLHLSSEPVNIHRRRNPGPGPQTHGLYIHYLAFSSFILQRQNQDRSVQLDWPLM